MKILRTPDDRFDKLSNYDFAPNYVMVNEVSDPELRVHYLDEGVAQGQVVLLMHGEPSWSYLYRKMIPGLVAAGCRVIAPDLIGFGRSDKPSERSDYTYQRHVDWMTKWLHAIDIKNVVLFCQDWGGLIGLRLVAENPDLFAGVVAANTFLPTGDVEPGDAFLEWQNFSQSVPKFPTGSIINGATVSELSAEVIAGYDAPYPDEAFKEGARQFPLLVPITPDNPASSANRDAWKVLSQFHKPFLTAFSDQDPITKGGDVAFQKMVPGAANQAHVVIKHAGHFLQEDKGEELAGVVAQFIDDNKIGH